ncbi:MAG TPA: arginine--tRNA ligase [Methanoregulaceae archaeon]|nr:arginine--tRNA ligase [Methanoregulaceae archaeon]HQJ87217.1 arginine--tRNA ligase [Methanoregulaceae archaeon]
MFIETTRLIRAALQAVTGEEDVLIADGGEHADLASTVAFPLAKKRRAPPASIAAELASRLAPTLAPHGIAVEATGPYLNFRFGPPYFAGAIRAALAPGYGAGEPQEARVVLEHTSANPNGPLHVGHIRNSIIGDTLARAFRKAGYPTEVQYYVNDMGRQIAIVVWGMEHLGFEPDAGEKPDHFIARVYVEANRRIEADPAITAEIDGLMQRVEALDPATVRAFRNVVARCLDGFRETLGDLATPHDRFVWESDFLRNGDMERVLSRLSRLPVAHQEEVFYLDLSGAGIENRYVLRRSDGTSVYAARDLAYHLWKGRNFDRVIDVLGADHKLIGAQLQATLSLIGELPPEIVHFEFVSLPEGSMSTRAGTFIAADDLIAETRRRAFEEVTVRRPELPEEERRAIAQSVALAAIRYDIIRISPEKSTVFDWKTALDFERQSGPYIQYAHARACSILEKAGGFTETFAAESPYEQALVRQIAKFPAVVAQAVAELRPHLVATYARELADLFNTFYHYEPVLRAEGEMRDARLTLVLAAQNTLREALGTLGIDALRSM